MTLTRLADQMLDRAAFEVLEFVLDLEEPDEFHRLKRELARRHAERWPLPDVFDRRLLGAEQAVTWYPCKRCTFTLDRDAPAPDLAFGWVLVANRRPAVFGVMHVPMLAYETAARRVWVPFCGSSLALPARLDLEWPGRGATRAT